MFLRPPPRPEGVPDVSIGWSPMAHVTRTRTRNPPKGHSMYIILCVGGRITTGLRAEADGGGICVSHCNVRYLNRRAPPCADIFRPFRAIRVKSKRNAHHS